MTDQSSLIEFAEQLRSRRMLLQMKQALPLEVKVKMTRERIREWYEKWNGKVYVAFSGGKDSTVLLHLVREMYPEVVAVFSDTGVEFPEIREFVHRFPNVVVLRPIKSFQKVLEENGYPIVSKDQAKWIHEVRVGKSEATYQRRVRGINWDGSPTKFHISKKWLPLLDAPFQVSHRCCHYLKTGPEEKWRKGQDGEVVPFLGTMAEESVLRRTNWMKHGCNAFEGKRPRSAPLSLWTEHNIWEYIATRGLDVCEVYTKFGYDRTGCVLCGFGAHLEKPPNRYQRLQYSHPKLWEWGMHRLGMAEVLDFCKIPWKDGSMPSGFGV